MSARCITHPDQADAQWLTEVLLEAGALRGGSVAAVGRDCQSSDWSRSVWLEPRYEESAEGERPQSLFLKICADAAESFGPPEVHYYTRDYRGYPEAPLVRCYDAAYQAAPRAYHLLLSDLRATHANGFQVPPSLGLARASADALARLHARYWGATRLAELGLGLATSEELQAYFSHIEPGLVIAEMARRLRPSPSDDHPLGPRAASRVAAAGAAALSGRARKHGRGVTVVAVAR